MTTTQRDGSLDTWRSLSNSELSRRLQGESKAEQKRILAALVADAKESSKATGGKNDERTRDAQRKADKRASDRDISIPSIVDPARRLRLEANDAEWLRFYLPDVFVFPFTADQLKEINDVGHCLKYGNKKALADRRGGGKTSIVRYLTLKYTLTRICGFALYVAATDGKAEQSSRAIKRRLQLGCRERNRVFSPISRLGEDYPFECSVAAYVSRAPSRAANVTTDGGTQIHVQWAGDQLILPSIEDPDYDAEKAWSQWMLKPGQLGSIMLAAGILGSMLQGANVFDMRPDFVALDDLDKRDSLAADRNKSATETGNVVRKIEDIIEKTIAGMKGQGRKMGQVMLCTVTARRSIAFMYTDPEQKPSWAGDRFKLIKSPPNREDLWDSYILMRQKGMGGKDDAGETLDPDGRKAHNFYLANFNAMNEGAVLASSHVHDPTVLPDGTQVQQSDLQWCYDFIADNDEEAFKTEYQQEPPEDDEVDRVILTAYHVQHNARSGLDMKIVPPGTVGLACGLDIKKVGFHYTVWAFSESPMRAACIEYNFHETKFAGDNLRVEDAERAILNGLHEWKEARDNDPYLDIDGNEFLIDLALIDSGWKHETWAGQPANQFCAEAGLNRFLPCKGWADGQYRKPNSENRRMMVGDNFHVSFTGQIPHINWNADHYKLKTHEGFLIAPGEPGSLSLFTPSATKSRRQQPHMSYAKHITAEVWEERFVPGYRGMVCKWWKDGSQNHYLDATAQAMVAMAMLGASTITHPAAVEEPPQEQTEQPLIHSSDTSNPRAW